MIIRFGYPSWRYYENINLFINSNLILYTIKRIMQFNMADPFRMTILIFKYYRVPTNIECIRKILAGSIHSEYTSITAIATLRAPYSSELTCIFIIDRTNDTRNVIVAGEPQVCCCQCLLGVHLSAEIRITYR